MGKEMKRFLVFCAIVNMLASNHFTESLNAQSSKRNGQEAAMNNQTGFSLSVPSEYTRQASQRGSVTRLDYTSKDYAGNGKSITKTAYVYTPYGYNEKGSKRYDILYLMHGWGGHAGEYFEMAEIKNVFDNLIEKGVHNINLVTPSHYALKLAKVLKEYNSPVPVVYNTSSYEKADTLNILRALWIFILQILSITMNPFQINTAVLKIILPLQVKLSEKCTDRPGI